MEEGPFSLNENGFYFMAAATTYIPPSIGRYVAQRETKNPEDPSFNLYEELQLGSCEPYREEITRFWLKRFPEEAVKGIVAEGSCI